MVVLGKGFDTLPPAVRRVVVSMDRAIHILPVPVVGEPAFLDLRPPEVKIALVDQEYPQLGVDTVDIRDDVRKFPFRNALQLSKSNHHARSSSCWIRLAFAVRWSTR